MNVVKLKSVRLARRIRRVRKKVVGTAERPRMAVARSHRNIEAQLIDDVRGRTLCAVSSRAKDLRDRLPYGGNVKAAAVVGQTLGERAKALGITRAAFDRRGRRYHGRIKALAEAARAAGLEF